MQQKNFDLLVFIGRFQPFHNGHLQIVRQALSCSARLLILCGSAQQPSNSRNPWSFSQIRQMVTSTLSEPESARIKIEPLMDHLYNESLWVCEVQQSVNMMMQEEGVESTVSNIGLIGLSEGKANYFPSRFPQWQVVDVNGEGKISGTHIRQQLFEKGAEAALQWLQTAEAKEQLSLPVSQYLSDYCKDHEYTSIVAEVDFIARYRQGWAALPYPPTFVTVDAVVIQSGHILLVERRAQPGKGLWALPGGFICGDETLQEAVLRELKEETRLKLPLPVLRGAIQGQRTFDAPYRSQRGRTITTAFLLQPEPSQTLPKVRGGDDAKRAFWLPLAQLDSTKMFEDHYFIIQAMMQR